MAYRTWLNVLLAVATLAAVLVLANRGGGTTPLVIEARDAPSVAARLRVEVSGAVVHPGVVEAAPGEQVADAIARAGGVTAEGDLTAVNTSRRVVDDDRVVVPRRGERPPLVDLNTASRRDIEALPGIGTSYADAILRARNAARFASSDDLVNRGVIPARVYEAIRDLVVAR